MTSVNNSSASVHINGTVMLSFYTHAGVWIFVLRAQLGHVCKHHRHCVHLTDRSTSTFNISSSSVGNVMFLGWMSNRTTQRCWSVTFIATVGYFGKVGIDDMQQVCQGIFFKLLHYKSSIRANCSAHSSANRPADDHSFI